MAKIDFTYTLTQMVASDAAHPMRIMFNLHYRVLAAFNGKNNRKTNLNACWKAARIGIYGRRRCFGAVYLLGVLANSPQNRIFK